MPADRGAPDSPLARALLARFSEVTLLAIATESGMSVPIHNAERTILADEAKTRAAAFRSLALALPEIDDEEELYPALAAAWLELRFEWQRHNLVANYATVRDGSCDQMIMARAGLVSGTLALLEGLLDDIDRERLMNVAVSMLDDFRNDMQARRQAA